MTTIAMEEYELMKDSKYRMYVAAVDKALKNFEYTSEWPDLISALGKLNKVLLNYTKFPVIPRRIKISKRLAQCMHPALPSGVHLKALETYDVIFKCMGTNRLSHELFIYSAGLFPLLGHAAMNVRPSLLKVYETHFVPLGERLRPALSGFLSGVLPGLESGSDHFERTNSLLEKVCEGVGASWFYTCIWQCVRSNSPVRLPAISYVLQHFNRKLSMEDQLYLMGNDIDVMVSGLCAGVQDSSVLVQRSALDLLLVGFPMHNTQLLYTDMVRLVTSSLATILRRDMSLNRRLYSWLLGSEVNTSLLHSDHPLVKTSSGSDSNKSHTDKYFELYSIDILVEAIRVILAQSCTEPHIDVKPYRLLTSLLDKPQIGPVILDLILFDVFRALYLTCLNQANAAQNHSNGRCVSFTSPPGPPFASVAPTRALLTTDSPFAFAGDSARVFLSSASGCFSSSRNLVTRHFLNKNCQELMKNANLLFNTLEAYYIWHYLGKTYEMAVGTCSKDSFKDSSTKDSARLHQVGEIGSGRPHILELCLLTNFLLDVIPIETYIDNTSEILPNLFIKIITLMRDNVKVLNRWQITQSLELCAKILNKIQPVVVKHIPKPELEPPEPDTPSNLAISQDPLKNPSQEPEAQSNHQEAVNNPKNELKNLEAKNDSQLFTRELKFGQLEKSKSDSKINENGVLGVDSNDLNRERSNSNQMFKKKTSPRIDKKSKNKKSKSSSKLYDLKKEPETEGVDVVNQPEKSDSPNPLPTVQAKTENKHIIKCLNIYKKFYITFLTGKIIPEVSIHSVFEKLLYNVDNRTRDLEVLLQKSVKCQEDFRPKSHTGYRRCSELRFNERPINLNQEFNAAMKLASNILLEFNTFPNILEDESSSEFPFWVKVLVVCGCYPQKNNQEIQMVAINTLLEMLSLAKAQSFQRITTENNTKVVVMGILRNTHVHYLENSTHVIEVMSQILWDFLGIVSNQSQILLCVTLLYQIHNIFETKSCVEQVIGRYLISENLTVEYFKRFAIIWHLSRDLDIKTPVTQRTLRNFDRSLLKILDNLQNVEKSNIKLLAETFLVHSLLRNDVSRIMNSLFSIFLSPNTARISISHVHIQKTDEKFDSSSTDLQKLEDANMKKICAISSVNGNVVYHVTENTTPKPPTKLKSFLFSKAAKKQQSGVVNMTTSLTDNSNVVTRKNRDFKTVDDGIVPGEVPARSNVKLFINPLSSKEIYPDGIVGSYTKFEGASLENSSSESLSSSNNEITQTSESNQEISKSFEESNDTSIEYELAGHKDESFDTPPAECRIPDPRTAEPHSRFGEPRSSVVDFRVSDPRLSDRRLADPRLSDSQVEDLRLSDSYMLDDSCPIDSRPEDFRCRKSDQEKLTFSSRYLTSYLEHIEPIADGITDVNNDFEGRKAGLVSRLSKSQSLEEKSDHEKLEYENSGLVHSWSYCMSDSEKISAELEISTTAEEFFRESQVVASEIMEDILDKVYHIKEEKRVENENKARKKEINMKARIGDKSNKPINIYTIHHHILLYCDVFDSDLILYGFTTLKNSILTNPRLFISCLATTGLQSSNNADLLHLLGRHRKSIFGLSFSGDLTPEYVNFYRGFMFLEILVSVCLNYARSFYPNLDNSKLNEDEINNNLKIQLASLELLDIIVKNLITLVNENAKGFSCYIGDMLSKCKLQKILLHCLLTSVRNFDSEMTFAEDILLFNHFQLYDSHKKVSEHVEAYQIQLLRLVQSLIILEHHVFSQQESVPSPPQPATVINGDNLKYTPTVLIPQQQMFLSAILSALRHQNMKHLHQNWCNMITSCLPYLGQNLKQISLSIVHQICNNIEKIAETYKLAELNRELASDYAITQLEALTIICHYCLLDSQQSALSSSTGHFTNNPGQIFTNLLNVFLPPLALDGACFNKQNSDNYLLARKTVLGHMPRIITSVAKLWQTLCTADSDFNSVFGCSKVVKQQLLEFLSPISLHHSGNFLAAVAVAWYERRTVITNVRKVLPEPNASQKNLVYLISAIRVIPIDNLVQTVHTVIKSPPPTEGLSADICLDVPLLELFYCYMQNATGTQLLEAWSSLLALLRESFTLAPPAQFLVISILHELMTKCCPLNDRKDQKDLQDVTAKLIECVSQVCGSCLEQTTWLRRNLAVKEQEVDMDATTVASKPGTVTDGSATPIYSVQAQLVLGEILAPILDICFGSQEKDKVVTILTSLMYNIVPYLRTHTSRNMASFQACSKLLASLSSYQYTRKAWKKDVFDLLLDNNLFQMEYSSLKYWKVIIDNLMTHDNTTFRDLMSRVSLTQSGSLSIFSSREQEYEQRAQLLKRLAFVILCSETDQYAKYMPDIQEQLASSLRLSVPGVQAQVFLCFRVILLRMSPLHVTSLWPIIISEMLQVFLQIEQELSTDTEEFSSHIKLLSTLDPSWSTNSNNGLHAHNHPHYLQLQLATAKLLDLALILPATALPQFQMYRWAFVGDDSPHGVHASIPTFVPHVTRIANLMDTHFPDKQIETMPTKPNELLLTTSHIVQLKDLHSFFKTLSLCSNRHRTDCNGAVASDHSAIDRQTDKNLTVLLDRLDKIIENDFLDKIQR